MAEVPPGTSVVVSADALGTRPKWLKWLSSGQAKGNSTLPSGHRRAVILNGTTRSVNDYYVPPVSLPSTDAEWRAVIFAPNGSYLVADGLTGIPIIGTPYVRLQQDAPAKAILQLPAGRENENPLETGYAKWSDGHTEPIKRGMELTVEYRQPDGTMKLTFRGMIYQIESGATITLTAYDRIMDLYQFSDQYQSTIGYRSESLPQAGAAGDSYQFTTSEQAGSIASATVHSDIEISADAYTGTSGLVASKISGGYSVPADCTWLLCRMADYAGSTPQIGDIIKQVGVPYYFGNYPSSITQNFSAQVALFRIENNVVHRITDWTAMQHLSRGSTSGLISGVMTFSVNWVIASPLSGLYIGIAWSGSADNGLYGVAATRLRCNSSSAYTVSSYAYRKRGLDYLTADTPLADWNIGAPVNFIGDTTHYYPEPIVYYEHKDQITVGTISVSGYTVSIPKSGVQTPSGSCISTPRPAFQLDIAYLVLYGTNLLSIVRDLIDWAGLIPEIQAGADLGQTTFYQTSTFDYLSCIIEIIKGGNYGIRASLTEPGKVEIYSKHTIDDSPVLSFTTDPDGVGEQSIVEHNLTAHWMAEKATQAILAENGTTSGLPIALETDDRLMADSLAEDLQSPLRGITSDNTMGTHQLMAVSVAGKIIQLHTNVFEGRLALAGYRTDVWCLSGNHTGGKPIQIDVPEYGAQGVAIPTAIEIGDGVTKISLDNIRTADRSEMARSMGLTGDALSNTATSLPSSSFIFARYDTYGTDHSGLALSTVTKVEFLASGGSVLATQSNTTYIKTLKDNAGYNHVCVVMGTSVAGYATNTPIAAVRFTMGGVAYTAVLDNPKFSIAGQALHADIRFKSP